MSITRSRTHCTPSSVAWPRVTLAPVRRWRLAAAWLLALGILSPGVPVGAQDIAEVGRVKLASGSAFLMRAGDVIPAEPGQPVYQSDGLRTGADGRLAVTLADDTRVSLGPGSEVRIDRFAFAPAEGRFGLLLSIARGLVAYVSGRLARLAPDSIQLETPAGIVGVRGTTLALSVTP